MLSKGLPRSRAYSGPKIKQVQRPKKKKEDFLFPTGLSEDYQNLSKKYKNFWAVVDKNTGRIAAFRWLYSPDDALQENDYGSSLIRDLYGAVNIGKQIATHPKYREKGLATALIKHSMAKIRKDVFNIIVDNNKKSLGFHKSANLGYRRMYSFIHPDGTNRTIFVKKFRPDTKRPMEREEIFRRTAYRAFHSNK